MRRFLGKSTVPCCILPLDAVTRGNDKFCNENKKATLFSGSLLKRQKEGISGKAMQDVVPHCETFDIEKLKSQEEGCNISFMASFVGKVRSTLQTKAAPSGCGYI